MQDSWKVLNKIEKLVDTLPYEDVSIKITVPNQTYELNKTKATTVQGFTVPVL